MRTNPWDGINLAKNASGQKRNLAGRRERERERSWGIKGFSNLRADLVRCQ